MNKYVFISYSSKDKKLVDPIIRELFIRLKNYGIQVIDPDTAIQPGDNIVQKIGEFLKKSDFIIVFVSRESIESQWVAFEIGAAIVGGKKLIQIVIYSEEVTDEEQSLITKQLSRYSVKFPIAKKDVKDLNKLEKLIDELVKKIVDSQ